MSTIVTRAGKGSPLTNTELDSNFTNLNTDKAELSGATFTGNLNLGDNVKLQLGNQTNGDLQIYHDGSNSYIAESNATGNLFIKGTHISLQNSAGQDALNLINGDAYIKSGGQTKLQTTSSGISVTGSVVADGLTSELGSDAQGKFSGWSPTGSTSTVHGAIELGSNASYQGIISYDGSNNTRFLFDNAWSGTGSTFEFRTNTAATAKTHLKIEGTGDISFYEDTGTTPKLFWDASTERLGLGTFQNATVATLALKTDANGRAIHIEENSGGESFQIGVNADGDLGFYNSGLSTPSLLIEDSGSSVFSGAVTSTGLTVHSSSAPKITISNGGGTSPNPELEFFRQSGVTARITYEVANKDLVITNDFANGTTQFKHGSSEQMRLSSGNVNIPNGGLMVGATTAPSAPLHVKSSVSQNYVGIVENTNSTNGYGLLAKTAHTGASAFAFGAYAASNPLMVVRGDGRVGIGVANPQASLDVASRFLANHNDGHAEVTIASTSNRQPSLTFKEGTTQRAEISTPAGSSQLVVKTGTTERMRIDASGNLLVGTTSAYGTTGTTINAAGLVYSSADADRAGQFDRTTNDGEIVRFSKAGTTVGSIGAKGGTAYLIGSNKGLRVSGSGLIPITTGGANSDATYDLGDPAVHFKDLYLSNKVYANYIGSSGDTNTNIYFPTGDQIRFITGGNERARIDSSGNVGIGVVPSAWHSAYSALQLDPSGGAVWSGGYDSNIGANLYQHGAGTFKQIGGSYGASYYAQFNGYHAFYTNGNVGAETIFTPTERTRIASNGTLYHGKTADSLNTGGLQTLISGQTSITQSYTEPLRLNRMSTEGAIQKFYYNGSEVGSVGTYASQLYIAGGDTGLQLNGTADQIRPCDGSGAARDAAIDLGDATRRFKDLYLSGKIYGSTLGIGDAGIQADQYSNAVKPFRPDITSGTSDNYLDLGTSSVRWVDIYATNGTIQTSDRNEKQDIEDLTEAEERVAVAAKGLLKKFRWKSAVEDKGDDARIHFGIIAQDLQDAFEAEGLDAGRYGMFTSNTWTNEDGEEQTRMGVRYSELLAFIISAI